ncbi:MAG: hypothetical protein ABIQ12_05360 [Opitutaceae bacterium]
MNKNILVAVPVGILAVAAFLLSRSSVSVESVVGYCSVLGVLTVAAMEYRINWRRLFGRS